VKIWIAALLMSVATFGSSFAFADCFVPGRGLSYRAVNRDTLEIRDIGRLYRMRVGICTDLRWARRIAFRSFGSFVCENDDLLILDPFSNRVEDRCWIQDIRRLR
jgi:hypothetical protein